jgi:isoamylase
VFTLRDLVSYDRKHNEANGEQNRDGGNDNHSWNCGVEGETDDPEVLALRLRQAKNMMTTLMLSQGVPMILAGDEFLRTQKGNNNAWCQDNDISWVNWDMAEENAEFLRFVRELIHLRKRHPTLRRRRFFTGEFRPAAREQPGTTRPGDGHVGPFPTSGPVRPEEAGLSGEWRIPVSLYAGADATAPAGPPPPGLADIHWHGVEPHQPNFGSDSQSLAFSLDGRFTGREHDPDYRIDSDFYVAFNAWREPLRFRIPPAPTRRTWHRVIDTSLRGPDDFVPEGKGPVVAAGDAYQLAPFAALVLVTDG